MTDAIQTRADLQRGHGAPLECRRAVAGLSLFSNAVLSAVALYQLGIVKQLPAPGVAAVNGSVQAYRRGVPDALLGMSSYAVTALLAGYGAADRAVEQPWIPVALAAKTVIDAGLAASMSWKSWRLFRRFSLLSVLVAGATAAALPFAIPEARRAIAELRNR